VSCGGEVPTFYKTIQTHYCFWGHHFQAKIGGVPGSLELLAHAKAYKACEGRTVYASQAICIEQETGDTLRVLSFNRRPQYDRGKIVQFRLEEPRYVLEEEGWAPYYDSIWMASDHTTSLFDSMAMDTYVGDLYWSTLEFDVIDVDDDRWP